MREHVKSWRKLANFVANVIEWSIKIKDHVVRVLLFPNSIIQGSSPKKLLNVVCDNWYYIYFKISISGILSSILLDTFWGSLINKPVQKRAKKKPKNHGDYKKIFIKGG